MRRDEASTWSTAVQLARRCAEEGDGCWPQFCAIVHDPLSRGIRRFNFLEGVPAPEDQRAEALVKTLEKLRQEEFSRLRRFFAHNESMARTGDRSEEEVVEHFRRWLLQVSKRAAIDHVRSLPEYQRGVSEPRLYKLITMTTRKHVAKRDENTLRMMASELLTFLDEFARTPGDTPLDERGKYRPALELWTRGHAFADIAERLALTDAQHARNVVRAAKAVLRRRFAAEGT